MLALVTLWKFLAASKLGLIFDECYYWEWSLHPQASYYDHPPMTAWLIMAGHALFGQTPLAVRFGAILSGILLALAGRLLGRDLFGKEAGNRAGIFLLLAPIFAGNSFLMTPDTFLMPAWAFAVYFAWRGSRGNMLWWLAAGLAAGLGMLSKYTMVLYFGGLALFWLSSPGQRGRLFLGISALRLSHYSVLPQSSGGIASMNGSPLPIRCVMAFRMSIRALLTFRISPITQPF